MKAFDLTQEPIDTEAWRGRLFDKTCGGYAAFEGWVRDHNEGLEVVRLEYEVYDALARSEGLKILSEAVERFGVTRAACVHRYGGLELGDVAVWVGVAAARSRASLASSHCDSRASIADCNSALVRDRSSISVLRSGSE